jgi:hypothetical protein
MRIWRCLVCFFLTEGDGRLRGVTDMVIFLPREQESQTRAWIKPHPPTRRSAGRARPTQVRGVDVPGSTSLGRPSPTSSEVLGRSVSARPSFDGRGLPEYRRRTRRRGTYRPPRVVFAGAGIPGSRIRWSFRSVAPSTFPKGRGPRGLRSIPPPLPRAIGSRLGSIPGPPSTHAGSLQTTVPQGKFEEPWPIEDIVRPTRTRGFQRVGAMGVRRFSSKSWRLTADSEES